MKKVLIFTAVLTALFISGCANKPARIERVSPCACYDTIIKAG